MEIRTTYFDKTGRTNTEACLEIVDKAIHERGFKHLVVATTEGDTALLFAERLKTTGTNIAAVTHCANFKGPNVLELAEDRRKAIESLGAKIHTGTMVTHSIETAFAAKFQGLYPTLIFANTLRIFGQGTKVAVEIVMMAADAGLIPECEEVLAVAGTARGADTVLVIKSAASKRALDLRVLEVLAKPRE
ncbi:MAG: hypothetical protein EPN22_10585 [Nitrospirae bacterium]|nr:MAG: hypothetical protein EPN22_10585 [Nitrospirota bacterium]